MSVTLPVRAAAATAAERPLYRPFFLAGIVATLTAGASWGAYLLLRIGAAGSFTQLSVFEINAHAQGQIYGWVGLFMLGFAYQAFPRLTRTPLASPPLARASLGLMVAGIVLRAVGEPLPALAAGRAAALGGWALQLAAVGIFAGVVWRTFAAGRAGGPLATWQRYALAAAGWFVVSTALDGFHLARLIAAPSREALLHQVATFQFPLRDLQIHGVAMLMIFAVTMRWFPGAFATAAPAERPLARAWLPLNLGLGLTVVSFVVFMTTKSMLAAGLMGVGTLAMAAAATVAAWSLHLFRPAGGRDRSLKFVRAGQVWLLVSLAMLVLAPLYFRLSGEPFSHAWYGATRHAITVGFISLTIMGVAGRVVPTVRGLDTRSLSPLWIPFVLVNLGCTLRVTLQVATDFTAAAFPLVGVSGLLEVTGLTVWGVGLARLMLVQDIGPAPAAAAPAPQPALTIDLDLSVAETVRRHPHTLPVLSRLGLDACCGGAETVRNAAEHNGVPIDALLEELQHA